MTFEKVVELLLASAKNDRHGDAFTRRHWPDSEWITSIPDADPVAYRGHIYKAQAIHEGGTYEDDYTWTAWFPTPEDLAADDWERCNDGDYD